jgi:predicted dehydrogenase
MTRLGFIGSGGIAQYHAGFLRALRGAEISCNADISESAAKEFHERFQTKRYVTEYRHLLDDDRIQGVLICLPTHLHWHAVVDAADAGKHVFCEKPMARDLNEATEMIAACRRARVKLMIGQVRRFDNHWGTIRKLVQEGAIGRPVIWRSVAGGGRPKQSWFCDEDKGMGPLVDGAIHNYDFARSMFGEADRAMSSMMRWRTDTTGLDTGTAIVQFKSGDDLVMSWTWGAALGVKGKNAEDVIGPQGAIHFSASKEDLPKRFNSEKEGAVLISSAGGESRVVSYRRNNMFEDQLRHFVKVVRCQADPLADGVEGRKSLAIAVAILEASARGEVVAVRTPR